MDELRVVVTNLHVDQARMRGDIEEIKANMVTRQEFRAAFDAMLSHIDGLAGKMQDSLYHLARQNSRLDDHETRIVKLETGHTPEDASA